MFRFLPSIILLLVVLFVPDFVAAQATNSIAPGGFVPCEGDGCRACDLISMINKIIKWLFGMFFILFAVLMTIAGFGLVTSGGNASALNEAKSKFNNALIGLLIMMSAWLVVDLVMRTLLKDDGQKINGYGPWSTVQCRAQTEVKPPKATTPSEGGVVVTPPPQSVPSGELTDAQARKVLGSVGVVVKEVNTSLQGIRINTVNNILLLKEKCNCEIVVTGGTETTGGHTTSQSGTGHTDGYKYDVRPNSDLNNYIEKNFTYIRTRDDGAKLYEGLGGAIFARESNHWDVKVP